MTRPAASRARPDKHFTATGFLVRDGRVLLLHHRKLDMWLPFGGHIDPGEDPDQALLREAREETGFEVEILGDRVEFEQEDVIALARPETILLELIEPGHYHVDLIYFVRPVGGAQRLASQEHHALRWFTWDDLDDPVLTDDVRVLGRRAIEHVRRLDGCP